MILRPRSHLTRSPVFRPKAHLGFRGFYTLEVQAPGGPRRKVAEFENLLLDVGLNAIGANSSYQGMAYCAIGTGINPAAPAPTDTQLENFIESSNTIGPDGSTFGAAPSSPYYGWYRLQYEFAPTIEKTLTEVGCGPNIDGTNLLSRALIVNAQGDPTPLTVLANETLYVTYEMRTYPVETDNTYQITINGVLTDIIVRASLATNGEYWAWAGEGFFFGTSARNNPNPPFAATGPIGTIEQSPSGTVISMVNNGTDPYANNSFAIVARGTVSIDKALADNPGVNSFGFTSRIGRYQTNLDPVAIKGPLNEMRVAMTWSWGNYTPP